MSSSLRIFPAAGRVSEKSMAEGSTQGLGECTRVDELLQLGIPTPLLGNPLLDGGDLVPVSACRSKYAARREQVIAVRGASVVAAETIAGSGWQLGFGGGREARVLTHGRGVTYEVGRLDVEHELLLLKVLDEGRASASARGMGYLHTATGKIGRRGAPCVGGGRGRAGCVDAQQRLGASSLSAAPSLGANAP